MTLETKQNKHYIAMSGTHGCLPDHCEVFESRQDALADLAQLFDLGRTRTAKLKAAGYLELGKLDGADYCEITSCECDCPSQHSDSEVR